MRALAAALCVLAFDCGSSDVESSSAAPQRTAPESDALGAANQAADELGRTLRASLLGAMADGGPPRAVEVCATDAGTLTDAVAARTGVRVGGRTGVRVGRASLRMRGDSTPPEWVVDWLHEQGERVAEGVTGFERIIDREARVLRPIVVEGPCLNCHGENLSTEVASMLSERYPNDRATGYRLGDLRGALYVEVPVGR